MKQWKRAALSLTCAAALVIGTAVATSTITTRTLQAQYMGITMEVNGQAITPKDANGNLVEPFAVDGTVYLPARALGEALGKTVAWDGETHTVSIGKAPMVEDAEQLISLVEATHPAFALDLVPEGYAAAKATFLEDAAKVDSLAAFTLGAMVYLTSLEDGHTQIDPFGGMPQATLDIGWAAVGDHLYLTDESGAPTTAQVTAIGGLSTADLFAALDRMVVAENQAARDANHTQWTRYPGILSLLGASFSDDGTTILTLLDQGTETTQAVGLVDPESVTEPVVTTEKMGNVFYVDLNQCVLGAQVDAAAGALKAAVDGGVTRVILDVRGNGGGNSQACQQLLSAVGMEIPQYGSYLRYSPLAQAQRGYQESEGFSQEAPDLTTAKANPKVKLVVLTDEDTFSSAQMLAVWVRDGKLGAVIGRPSANNPNHYGDILYYQLSHTGLMGTISHIQWQRPDTQAAPGMLVPDVETAIGEDSLQAALAFLK